MRRAAGVLLCALTGTLTVAPTLNTEAASAARRTTGSVSNTERAPTATPAAAVGGQRITYSAFGYTPVSPARLLDTRAASPTIDGAFAGGGAVGANRSVDLTIAGRDGLPSSGVGAVALNVTAVDAAGDGFVTVWP